MTESFKIPPQTCMEIHDHDILFSVSHVNLGKRSDYPVKKQVLRQDILDKVREYFNETKRTDDFKPGIDYIPVSGKVLDDEDLIYLIDASLDLWLTSGRFAQEFEKKLANFVGTRFSLLTNSGSSANLLAVSALCSPLLGAKRLAPGDEIITAAASFPTTVNPIIQNGLVPVFLDAEISSYNPNIEQLEKAISPRTKAVIFAHTLGNPFDLATVKKLTDKYNLWLIEDCCDALGSEFSGKKVGQFGDLATLSFYPAHHITTGEGGAVLTNRPILKKIVASIRDWGRDCWCDPGKDNTCQKRFCSKLPTLMENYDHKYTYSHIGYNLKVTDMQAAIGVSQLKKLPQFIKRRKENFSYLVQGLLDLEDYLILPKSLPNADPSWFGFPITLRPSAPISRNDLVESLERLRIGTRLLFGSNLLHQPAYQGITCRIPNTLEVSDQIMRNTFWIGVYPGLEQLHLDYVIATFKKLFSVHDKKHSGYAMK